MERAANVVLKGNCNIETDTKTLAALLCNPVDFQFNNEAALENESAKPFIQVSFFMSKEEVVIHIASYVIDVAKSVQLFIENDKDICGYVSSKSDSAVIFSNLSICNNEPLLLLAPKPIQPSRDIFSDHESVFDIRFRNCNEYAAGDVYDRLLYAMGSISDFFVANMILASIKELVHNANPLFATAKVARLLGYKSPVFEEQSVSDLSDVCGMEEWNISIPVAKGIFDSLDKQIKLLVVPSATIESLTADLSERAKYVVENRGLKAFKTLEELGSEIGLTRERVRQITAKVERGFRARSKLNRIKNVFYTLKVLFECEHCFTVDELNKYMVSEEALMFLSGVLGYKYALTHVTDTDCIVFCDKDGKCEWLETIEKISGSFPALLLPSEQKIIIEQVSTLLKESGYSIPDNIVAALAFHKYVKNGTTFVKKSLRMGDRYEIVLEKFFPDGIKLYDAENMELFRKGYAALFDDDKISENDRAVVSRVTDRCILIGRGTYILNKKTELPTDLSQRILDYIMQYPFDMVMTNAIMHRFNEELTAIGVDNKYYLLSVLKQHYSDMFSFRRDYVIKAKHTGNFYDSITGFVELKLDGVSFYDLQTHFQGIPDAVLSFALSEDDNIIPMYNKMFIHKSKIIFAEHRKVLGFLQKVVSQEHVVSDERVFSLLKREYPDFIANNNINTGWFLFSILRSFFQDDFKFARPHIIDPSFDSSSGREALRSFFWGKKYVNISDIKNYAKEKQIQIYDLSKLLDSYSDRYFIFNKERLISIDEIGYSPDEFAQVEDIVIQALGSLEYCEISKLNVVNGLPKANVALTEWIVYSIINKYGTQLSATTSTPQFMNSVPLVFRNSIDIETVRDDYASSGVADQTVRIDDLADIDSLVEGIIDFEL